MSYGKKMNQKIVRYEPFGGIVGIQDPPALVYVDRQAMRELGYQDSPLWHGSQKYLSAPTEVHFNITNQCPLNCRHCTSDSGNQLPDEMTTAEIKKAIDVLAGMKVFHIAFGGGELFSRPDAIELASYASAKGIVPNATSNGYYMTPELAEKCRVFGQINISIDGVGDHYGIIRGTDNFRQADLALKTLIAAGVNTGINCLATRKNFDLLEEVVAYADQLQLTEVLFLRLKPSGRAREIYHEYKLDQEQNRQFFPFLMKMAKKYHPLLQVDCSFIPNICYHHPSKKTMNVLGIEGCEGGNILLGLRPDGWMNACSHYPQYFEDILKLPELWHEHNHFQQFRERQITDQDCLKCRYFKICRGGCPLFAEFLGGDFNLPDPECPVLIDKRKPTGFKSGVKHRTAFS
jgi:radical SAM protein with 4Fe4S-binding SPASM domain